MKNAGETTLAVGLRRGFTLVEVMLAVFILAIGMIMVITIFPIGVDWTRQATETAVGQSVAQNALGIIESHYPFTANIGVAASQTTLIVLPGCTDGTIPVSEMCYQFGSSSPSPANPKTAVYFWTAYVRATPGQSAGTTVNYDVYILVFKKGSPDQLFGGSVQPTVNTSATYNAGTYSGNSVQGAVPPVGEYGIGMTSGTVFRQVLGPLDTTTFVPTSAAAVPPLAGGEPILIGPPADNRTNSPLVYVYSTTIAWKHP